MKPTKNPTNLRLVIDANHYPPLTPAHKLRHSLVILEPEYDTIPPPPANTAGPCSETYVAGRSVQRIQAKVSSRYRPQPAAAMLLTALLYSAAD